ncbi:MAG: hypothetical protein QOI63_1314 [Thermoplasmata archaeon]|jgi:hypothetical protein|nr:hypothetical protein [Thermoplasmata archaeon]
MSPSRSEGSFGQAERSEAGPCGAGRMGPEVRE